MFLIFIKNIYLWKTVRERIYQFIGAASGWGAKIRTCEEGPAVLKASCSELLKKQQIPITSWDTLYPQVRFKEKDIPLEKALPVIVDFNNVLSDKVFDAMHKGHFPIVLGGDHSIAVGTWNGVGCFLSQQSTKPLGLIWIDAHMDSHTLETTPSGAWHGMPLAALLGYGEEEFVQVKRKAPSLMPENVCLICTRSYEEEEAKLLEKLKVRIYFIEEVKKRGFATVLREAIALVSKNTVGYGVTLDIDAVDPIDAPGAGSREPGGVRSKELLQGLSLLSIDPHLKAFELVEFNPSLDVDNKTCTLCQQILSTVLLQGNPHG
jgi:arginase